MGEFGWGVGKGEMIGYVLSVRLLCTMSGGGEVLEGLLLFSFLKCLGEGTVRPMAEVTMRSRM